MRKDKDFRAELLKDIKNNDVVKEFLKYKKVINENEEYKQKLIMYKDLLIENQLDNLFNVKENVDHSIILENLYEELSSYEVLNEYFVSEYKVNVLINGVIEDLTNLVENLEME